MTATEPTTGILNVRSMNPQTQRQIKAAAAGRGIITARYLDRLVALHATCVALADGGDGQIKTELQRLGLERSAI